MNNKIVRCSVAELLCDLYQCEHMKNKQIAVMLNVVAVTKVMMKEMKEEDKEKVKKAIRVVFDYVTDATCVRRLARLLS